MNLTRALIIAAWATVGLCAVFLLSGCQHLSPEAKARIRADLEREGQVFLHDETSPETRVTWLYRLR